MTIPDPPVHYDVTRVALIRALVTHPLTEQLTPQARERMAGKLLAQMPAMDEAASRAAERERIAVLAVQHHARASCEDCTKVGESCGLGPEFADVIRAQS